MKTDSNQALRTARRPPLDRNLSEGKPIPDYMRQRHCSTPDLNKPS